MPRLALFDLDDTLIDSTGTFSAWAAEFIEKRGLGGDAWSWFAEEKFWTLPPEECFSSLAAHFGLDDDPVALLNDYRGRCFDLMSCYNGVLDGLEALRDTGWRIGIVTNGYADFQAHKIQAVGLGAYVDVVCVSDAEGAWKPEQEIFRRASELAGAPLEGAWMVGDSLPADIAGGNALGLHTAWVRHGRTLPADAPVPTYVLEHTADVFPLILRWPAFAASDERA
jgi:FMN phosphatase YigB (HAD superfamily)